MKALTAIIWEKQTRETTHHDAANAYGGELCTLQGQAGVHEEGRGVVEDGIDATQLLA